MQDIFGLFSQFNGIRKLSNSNWSLKAFFLALILPWKLWPWVTFWAFVFSVKQGGGGAKLDRLQRPFPLEVSLNQWIPGCYVHIMFIWYIALLNYVSVHVLRLRSSSFSIILFFLKFCFYNHKDIWKVCPWITSLTLV